jgi:hypothetical protein
MFCTQNHATSDEMAQIVANPPVCMTLRARFFTNMSDLWIPLRDFRSARERKTTKVRQYSTSLEEECDLHVIRHSARACDVYQTTVVPYLYEWELQIMLNWTRLSA